MHSRHVTLSADVARELLVASLKVTAEEILRIDGVDLTIDTARPKRLADNHTADGKVKESADARSLRIRRPRDELKAQGVKGFLNKAAAEEGVAVSRVKQILARKTPERITDSQNHRHRD